MHGDAGTAKCFCTINCSQLAVTGSLWCMPQSGKIDLAFPPSPPGVCDPQHGPLPLYPLLCPPATGPECTVRARRWYATVSWHAGPCVRNSCQSSSYHNHRESAPRCCEHSCWRIMANCHRRWCLERNWTVPIIAHDKQEWMCECHRWSVYSHSYDFSVCWCFGIILDIFFPGWKNLADFSQLIIQLVNNHPWIVPTSVTLDTDFCLLVIWKEIEIRKYNLHEGGLVVRVFHYICCCRQLPRCLQLSSLSS